MYLYIEYINRQTGSNTTEKLFNCLFTVSAGCRLTSRPINFDQFIITIIV